MTYLADIGLEVHAELATRSKMFCACPVIDPSLSEPNSAVCPVCLGLPGTLPVVNQRAVEFGMKVALALGCQVAPTSLFARKNYFYPDLPKGYQISQYEYPLAEHGSLPIRTSAGIRSIRIRRVHLEEDTGKLTHIENKDGDYSLVDLNRAGVPLLEIVSEPDMHSVEEVRSYSEGLRRLLRHLGVNSGDMEKGAIRFEANVSIHPAGSNTLGTRVEIKNLNSFRAMENAITYQLAQQKSLLESGKTVLQETLGWDSLNNITISQRSKEEAHDYRYFPEPDLPPLLVDKTWIEQVAQTLPELPFARQTRFMEQYGLSASEAELLVDDEAIAAFFEECSRLAGTVPIRTILNWMTGELFAWLNQSGEQIAALKINPIDFVALLQYLERNEINLTTAKVVLAEMLQTGAMAATIIEKSGLQQVSDINQIASLITAVLDEHPAEVNAYQSGKETLLNWFFGQVMRQAGGKANPQVVRAELESQLQKRRK